MLKVHNTFDNMQSIQENFNEQKLLTNFNKSENELKDLELFLFSSGRLIKRKLKDFKLVFYIFDENINAKVWQFLGTNYFINDYNHKIYKGKETAIYANDNIFDLVYSICKNIFYSDWHSDDRIQVTSYLAKLIEEYPDYKKEYWNKIIHKLENPIKHNGISKKDRHNLAKFIEDSYFKLERLKGTL